MKIGPVLRALAVAALDLHGPGGLGVDVNGGLAFAQRRRGIATCQGLRGALQVLGTQAAASELLARRVGGLLGAVEYAEERLQRVSEQVGCHK